MSERLAAGWARSSFQSVSVVPIDPVPAPGDDEEHALLGAQDQAGVELQAVARHHQVDALRGAHVELAALADHVLDVVGPDAGRVDHLAGADLEAPRRCRGRGRRRRSPARPRGGSRPPRCCWRPRRRSGRRCGRRSSCGGRRRPARRSTGRRRPGRRRAAPARSAVPCAWRGDGGAGHSRWPPPSGVVEDHPGADVGPFPARARAGRGRGRGGPGAGPGVFSSRPRSRSASRTRLKSICSR